MDSKCFNDVDTENEAMVVDAHAEAWQMPSIAKGGKLFVPNYAAVRLDNLRMNDVTVISGSRICVLRVPKYHLK